MIATDRQDFARRFVRGAHARRRHGSDESTRMPVRVGFHFDRLDRAGLQWP